MYAVLVNKLYKRQYDQSNTLIISIVILDDGNGNGMYWLPGYVAG